MERLRRGQVVNFWLINFWSSKGTFCCMYIMAALFQIRNSNKSLKFDHSAKVHCVQGLSFITKIHLKICVELRCGRSQALHCVGRLITLLQEASFFGDSWETPPKSMQWSFRRRKRSTKLSSTQFAADSVQQPCQASTTGCRRVGRAVRRGQGKCPKLSFSQTWQCTKPFLSCSANRRKTILWMCFLSSDIRTRPSFICFYSNKRV